MAIVLAVLTLVLLVYAIWSLIKVPFAAGRRKRQLGRAGLSFIAALAVVTAFAFFDDTPTSPEAAARAPERAEAAEARRTATEAERAETARIAEEQRQEARRVAAEQRAEAARKAEAEAAAKEAECRRDLSCWGERANRVAAHRCVGHVERLAKFDYEWTDGFLETKFSHYRWRNISEGTVTLLGDKIKFQNGFGAWQHHTYECDVDPAVESILDVRAGPGRL